MTNVHSPLSTIEKLKTLASFGEHHELGRDLLFFHKGWLHIEDEGNRYNVFYTSSKDTHNRGTGPAYMVDFEKKTGDLYARYGLTGAWKTALSLWPVDDPEEAREIFQTVAGMVDEAYNHRKQYERILEGQGLGLG